MATFFFDFIDGDHATHDRDGHECECVEAARLEVLRVLPEIFSSAFRDVDTREVTCSVRDETGTIIYSATLTLNGHTRPTT